MALGDLILSLLLAISCVLDALPAIMFENTSRILPSTTLSRYKKRTCTPLTIIQELYLRLCMSIERKSPYWKLTIDPLIIVPELRSQPMLNYASYSAATASAQQPHH